MIRPVDVLVLALFLAGLLGYGLWFGRRRPDSAAFMTAGGRLPGWAVGLSLFGSYVSSISFLANPGKSYDGNWNAFVFNLTVPLAAWIAVRFFVPFFRGTGEVSAYEHLERRFGAWARSYAVVCWLFLQTARMGTVLYLLALAVEPLTGWPVPAIILGTGALMTLVTLLGGMEAVVWTGVVQSAVLLAGAAVALGAVLLAVPGGAAEIVRRGDFSLGSFGPELGTSTFWVVLVYGLVTHLQNLGTDQGYIQRYVTARSEQEAARSVWIIPACYIPVAAAFFFVGTGLSVFYGGRLNLPADKVFPHFIATEIPAGLAGLVVAGVFAAALDPNLGSMATLTLRDLYQRYVRPGAGDRECLRVLRGSMLAWGALGSGAALAMIRVKSALDAWWSWAGVFGGGILGLFLLGRLVPRARGADAAFGAALGVALIAWMTFSSRSPFHPFLVLVFGTAAVLAGGTLSALFRRPACSSKASTFP